jgi:NADH:ubiquinone oxidoreductase subunit 2 (subunit N)
LTSKSFETFSPVFMECLLSLFLVGFLILVLTATDETSSALIRKNPLPLWVSSGGGFLQIFLVVLLVNFFANCTISHQLFCGALSLGSHGAFYQIVLFLLTALVAGLTRFFLSSFKFFQFEYNVFLLFAVLGLSGLCFSSDALSVFLTIELQSLAFYLLATSQ